MSLSNWQEGRNTKIQTNVSDSKSVAEASAAADQVLVDHSGEGLASDVQIAVTAICVSGGTAGDTIMFESSTTRKFKVEFPVAGIVSLGDGNGILFTCAAGEDLTYTTVGTGGFEINVSWTAVK